MNKLNIARILVVAGLLVGWNSLRSTFRHIGDPLFTVSPEMFGGAEHSWYHALREGVGDVATIVALLVIFFGKPLFRNTATWWLALILMIGYYSPFWVGMPFNPALGTPVLSVELAHIGQAALPLIGLLLARNNFIENDLTPKSK